MQQHRRSSHYGLTLSSLLLYPRVLHRTGISIGLPCGVMGRVKLKIRRLEELSDRKVTYSKRRSGIMKKAKELSVLCDIDILLLMFSPKGEPTLCLGEHSNIEKVIAKYAQLTPQERAKRKLESLEALKKAFKKLDHDVNIPDFLRSSTQTVEELANHSQNLQSQISELERKLSCWTDPEKVNSLEQITQMEETMRESLIQIQMHKKYIGSQLMSLDCAGEFHSGMHFPISMINEQQPPQMQWLQCGDDRDLMLAGVPSFMPQRNLECSTEGVLQGYNGYLSSESGALCSKQEQEYLNNLDHNSCLQLKLGAQYPYHSYGLNLFGGEKFKPDEEINLQEGRMDFQFHGFEPPRPVFDAGLQSWVNASGSCGVPLFDGHPYTQPKQT